MKGTEDASLGRYFCRGLLKPLAWDPRRHLCTGILDQNLWDVAKLWPVTWERIPLGASIQFTEVSLTSTVKGLSGAGTGRDSKMQNPAPAR